MSPRRSLSPKQLYKNGPAFCYHDSIMQDPLAEHLNALARDECYRVDEVLKESPHETTERVYFKGVNGSELGPFVRKRIDRTSGIGSAYISVCEAQRAGRRFVYLPRIIDCYDAGDTLVVVMEYVGGETLADVVYRCDPSLALACDVFPRLCDAVAELHEGFDPPLIHRDLKPSNIMLSRDSMTIIDFGITRVFKEDSEEDTRHFGTRAYAPPEQFGYGQTDVRSDVYALGMLLYFCLTEKTPDAKARRTGFADPQIPETLRSIIVRATAFDPADRYASVSELKQAFEGASGMDSAAKTMSVCTSEPATISIPTSPTPLPYTGEMPFVPTLTRTPLAERIPIGVGILWDVVLVLTFVLFVWAAASLSITPTPGSSLSEVSFLYRVIGYSAVVIFIFAPGLFVLRARRPLRRLFPRLPELKRSTEVLFAIGGIIVCIVVFVLLGVAGI